MPLLPVLDLMHGQIVRGIAGDRDSYRPITSQLTASADPAVVAAALHDYFGFTEFYLADLDAIQGGRPTLNLYQQLQSRGLGLWIDAGLRCSRDETLAALLGANAGSIIIGLESVAGPDELAALVRHIGPERAVFSLDLKAGAPLGRADLWQTTDPWTIAERAIVNMGVKRVIVLDLSRVGMGKGTGTETWCARIRTAFPQVELTAGGGIRGADDVRELYASGVNFVLVASALHDGRLTRAEVACL